ncbi:MAG: metallophosphoesterase [Segetibacter sp.]|nr:metallophosphoesterase [Segetibacter sp.]
MKLISGLLIFLLVNLNCSAQDSIQARIILVGDAGQFKNGKHPVISSIKQNIKFDKKTTVLFLGDNLYHQGLPDEAAPNFNEARAVLDSQTNIADVSTGARVFFIPGNHDWDRGSRRGWEAVLREQRYIDILSDRNVKFFPEGGCPGPVEVPISDDVVMILMDSQWWIQRFGRPGIESDCPYKTEEEVLSRLEDILTNNSRKLVILATHHPFKSYGIHGGYFPFTQHIFPLTDIRKNLYIPMPIIGSIYPVARGVFGTPQDLKHPLYMNMVNRISEVAKRHPNIVFVAGHEHNQQLIKDSSFHYIVEGAGCKETRVSNGKNAVYTSDSTGYAIMEISKSKNLRVTFFDVADTLTVKKYSNNILNFSTLPSDKTEDTLRIVYVPYNADSITISTNPNYAKASKVKRFFNGDNYREEWATPVRLPVFKLREKGFTIVSLGGGKQTKSLRLKDAKGKEWTLRTIDKELTRLLPVDFRSTVAEDFVKDFVSTAHPFSPLIVPPLAKATNVIVAKPKIYFVPNDGAFGFYRTLFANKVALLEEREPTLDGEDTKSSATVMNKLIDDNDDRVDQEAVLRARLLDLLIADWDRHFDQWRFGEKDTGKGKLYYPIPRDRDQAFSYSDGALVRMVAKNIAPFLKGFKPDIPNVEWLAYWGRDFDRLFMNRLDKKDWERILIEFQKSLDDATIEKAVRVMPPEIFAINGLKLIDKLKSRRNLIVTEGMRYYRFLSEEVNIAGSNKKEYFKVSNSGNQLEVKMFKRTNEIDSASLMYSRKFDAKDTKEVRLYGLSDDDVFEIQEDASSKIKLRIIGGKGKDTFDVKGNVANSIYDNNTESNRILNQSKTNREFSNNPDVNQYSPIGYQYNTNRFPRLNLGYNVEDGLMVGVGFLRQTYGFRKEPYATQQKLSTLYAPASGAYQLKYGGEFNQIISKGDLVVNAEVVHPVLNNFFGLGNLTIKDPAHRNDFYRVRYNYMSSDVLARKRLGEVLSAGFGATFYHYWNRTDDNANKILSRPSLIGLDSLSVYTTKSYAGGKAFILINNLNNELFPTRGINWLTQFTALGSASGDSKPYTALTSDMTVYSSFSEPAKYYSVLRLGAGKIYSKGYEYFQALNLGQNNYLRGFRKNRFSGRSLAYGSFELRVKLTQSRSYVLPGDIGVVGFTDVGRVWIENEESRKWHHGFGGGLYYVAYNTVLISATVGFSEEEKLFNFTLGTKLNLTF